MTSAWRNDLGLYDRHADAWWDRTGWFAASLHGVNDLRVQHLSDVYGGDMRGVVVVDLGCGGGLLAEPMASRGATVIGIDQSEASIAVARSHGAAIPGLRYEVGDARAPSLPDRCADLVTCADLIEHVDGWPTVVAAAARMLRPGGRLYVSTLNRTFASRILAVHVAETLRLIPVGTHDPARLIRPGELLAAAQTAGLRLDRLLGERLRLAATLRHWAIRIGPGSSTRLGYAAWFIREGA